MGKNIEIGGRIHSIATGNVVTGANEVLDDTLNKKQSQINQETNQELGTLSGKTATIEGNISDIEQALGILESIIPSQASSDNQLADKEFVNSSIATNTGFFKGTYQSAEDLPSTGVKNNDYAFVISTDAQGDPSYARYKYVVVEGVGSWVYEYTLNNSSFTAEQWAAIQSGITAALVTKLKDLPLKVVLDARFNTKVDKVTGKGLSTNDYTNEDQAKLQGLPTGEDLTEDLEDIGDEIAEIKHDMNMDYNKEYLTIESLEDNNQIYLHAHNQLFTVTVGISTDGGVTWTDKSSAVYPSGILATINRGEKLLIKNTGRIGGDTSYNYFRSGKQIKIYGNIMSLLYGDDFVGKTLPADTLYDYTFCYLFNYCTGLVSAENLKLPSNTHKGCYAGMFYGCTSLKEAPKLPATTLAQTCYYQMFGECTSLSTAPELPATTLAQSCYSTMFRDCTSLKEAPKLPATILTNSCYTIMFYGCTSLKEAPELPATTLAESCYNSMFMGCTSLKEAPKLLPATTLISACYTSMFRDCTSLVTAPELPATTLANSCCNNMFYNCTSLKEAPVLHATTLANGCYHNMFYGCTNLNIIKCLGTPRSDSSTDWVFGVAQSGTFIKADGITWSIGTSGIPTGWKVYDESESGIVRDGDLNPVKEDVEEIKETLFRDYSKEYLTIESLVDNNIISFRAANDSLVKTISISIDGGSTWEDKTSTAAGTTLATINTGDRLLIKGTNDSYGNSTYYSYFSTSGNFKVYGNIMSLIYGDNFIGQTTLNEGYTFKSLFMNRGLNLVDAGNIILPATTLRQNCYESMFKSCTSIKSAPNLPATTLAYNCYDNMFYGCTSLIEAPELPATMLTNNCYKQMFSGCTSIKEAPELHQVTILADNCYQGMFYGCISLKEAPKLPVNILRPNCYSEMFAYCTSLKEAPKLPATTMATNCYLEMFRGCRSLKKAPELPATRLASGCYYGMFRDCDSIIEAPELPATTLSNGCYNMMFFNCTSLKDAPELPATTLASSCYNQMFQSCTSLNNITCLATTNISASNSTYQWLYNVASTGTFITADNPPAWGRGISGIPSGWNVYTKSEYEVVRKYQLANYVQSTAVKNIVVLTQTEFDALTTYDNNTEYNVI